MNLFKSFAIAFSMYSKIPVPSFSWETKEIKSAILFFPLVGLVIGALVSGLVFFAEKLSLPAFPAAGILFSIPLLVTGGIHADGFIDTSDALASYAEREKKIEILKDPHLGAFALIHFVTLCVLMLSFEYYIIYSGKKVLDTLFVWALTFVLSRILSGLSVEVFPKAKKEGTINTFASDDKRWKKILVFIFLAEFIICVFFMFIINIIAALFIIFSSLVVFAFYFYISNKNFGGTSGDLCGWFLCICETAGTFAYCLFLYLC